MMNRIDAVLMGFRSCFSRQATFGWFVVVMVGLIVRFDHEGVSSIVRWLALEPSHYDGLIHFFYAAAWQLDELLACWANWAVNHCPLVEYNQRPVLIGDGIKSGKEARKTPGIKLLHQESDHNSKKEYIFGHHFGFVGLLIGSAKKAFCLSLEGTIHEGVGAFHPEKGFKDKPATLVTRMANQLLRAAKAGGRGCYATVDAYFSVGPMFLLLQAAVNEAGEQWVHLITRAKNNYIAYCPPAEGEKAYQEKDKIWLMELFDHPHSFVAAQVMMYGQLRTISYCCLDLLWKPVKGMIRFVMIQDGDGRYILMGSDPKLSAVDMIAIYAYRTKIEVMFDALKYILGAFCYHFWSKLFPKVKRGQVLEAADLSELQNEKLKATLTAIERFVNLAAMAMGLLQYLSLTATNEIWLDNPCWFRTYSSACPSEQMVKNVVANEFFHQTHKVRSCQTLAIIRSKQRQTLTALKPET